MTNRNVFQSAQAAALTTNDAGGAAYARDARSALASYAVTGTFNDTFYVSGDEHLARVKQLCEQVDLRFVAKLAVYARQKAYMKDVPAFLAAWVFAKDEDGKLFDAVFPRVIDNGKMLCTFWQIVRSGAVGRKSFGSRAKRTLRGWFSSRTDAQVFHASIGTSDPSLADVIRVVHPNAETDSRSALYGYLSGRNPKEFSSRIKPRGGRIGYREEDLPELVKKVETFKLDPEHAELPDVSFLLLSSLPLQPRHWREISLSASWQTLRMNLNTFQRHGVFLDEGVVMTLANKLRDRAAIEKARVFPYQLLAAYQHASPELPRRLVDALHDAMEVAVENVPAFGGEVAICVDVSGSMISPVTGSNGTVSSKIRCVDVAALVASCVLRRNPQARLLPFAEQVKPCRLEPRDSILTNAGKLAAMLGGGTDCGALLRVLNGEGAKVDRVWMISDNESWVDRNHYRKTSMQTEWNLLASRLPTSRLVCNDITPNGTSQTLPHDSILKVGGFSDEVFTISSMFLDGELRSNKWLSKITEIDL